MKKFGIIALMGVLVPSAFADFSLGNLVVFRVGDGSAALTNASTSAFVDQYSTAGGAAVSSTALSGLTVSGTATSEGVLSLAYYGGDYTDVANFGVSYAGYNALPGTAGIASTATTVAMRRAGVLRFNSPTGTQSAVDLTSATNPFSGNNIRGTAFDGINGKFLAVGGTSGVFRADTSGAGTVVSTTNNVSNRTVQISGNDAYWSTGSGTRGVYLAPGAMTAAAPVTASLIFAEPNSMYDFQIERNALGAPVSIIAADDTASALGGLYYNATWDPLANGGVGGFTAANTTQLITGSQLAVALGGTGSLGLRHIAVIGTDVFGTTTETSANRIVKISFANGFTSAFTGASVVATAGANTAFRGLEVVPEPASFAILGLGVLGLAIRRKRSKA